MEAVTARGIIVVEGKVVVIRRNDNGRRYLTLPGAEKRKVKHL